MRRVLGSRLEPAAGIARRLLVVSALVVLAGCGGGTEIAPSAPQVGGQGTGTASIDGVDVGSTQLVAGGVAGAISAPTQVTDEPVTFSTVDNIARLAHGALDTTSLVLTDASGTTTYIVGLSSACTTDVPPCDYWFEDVATGVLRRNPASTISSTPPLPLIDYRYGRRLLELSVGIAFEAGTNVRLTIYNVDTEQTAPVTITALATAPPPAPHPMAFNVELVTEQTTAVTVNRTALADPANVLTIDQLDLTLEGNPCIAGHVTAVVAESGGASPVTLDADFETPGC